MPVVMEEGDVCTSSKGTNGVVLKDENVTECPVKVHSNGHHGLNDATQVTTPTSSLSDEESVSSKEASVVTTPVKPQPPESISKEKADEPSNDEDSQKASGAQDGSKEKQEEEKENSGFKVMTLQLVLPGVAEPIDILHIGKDTVNDLVQYAFERPESCYRTCLGIYFKGKRIDNFSELRSIEGLVSGSKLELVEVPYTLRDVLVHVQRLQELVLSNNPSPSQGKPVLRHITVTDLDEDLMTDPPKDFSGLEPPPYCMPPDTQSLPNTTTTDTSATATASSGSIIFTEPLSLLSNYYPNLEQDPSELCLKSLCYSSWNPPIPNRKMKGDILYIDVETLEGDKLCITATPSGFYVNRTSTNESFDPQPRKTSHFSYHLITLLQQVSPLFKKNFAAVQKHGEKRNVIEMFPSPYPVYPWTVPKEEYHSQTFRLDDNMGLVVVADELLVGQLRDWNEELQSTRELPSDSLQERVFRDRSLFKVHSDFVQAAVKGAMAAVDGQLHPLNPADSDRHHMYLWNNIFFSTGFDGRGHFKEFGGEEAGHVAANYDLQGVDILEKLQVGIKGLCTLGAVLVDYRGYRVFCQSIVPGLLQKEHDSSIVYGSMDNGKTFNTNEKFHEIMMKCGKELNLRPHKLTTSSGDTVEVPISVEVKGIKGNDDRLYVLDMFRILPPDAIYTDPEIVQGNVDNCSDRPTANRLGLRHKLYLLRQELVESYIGTMALQLHLISVQKMMKEAKKEKSADDSSDDKVSTTANGEVEVADKGTQCEDSGNTVSSEETVTTTVAANGLEESPPTTEPTLPTDTTESEQQNLLDHLSFTMDSSLSHGLSSDGVIPSVSKNDVTSFDENQKNTVNELMNVLVVDEQDLTSGKLDVPDISVPDDLGVLQSTTSTDPSPRGSDSNEDNSTAEDTAASDEEDEAKEKLLKLYKDFSITFNPDVFTAGLKSAESDEVVKNDRLRNIHLAQYLTFTIIPKFIRECLLLSIVPLDGAGLKSLMHERGINMRYLGRIATVAAGCQDLHHLYRLCISEMVLRVSKRKLRKILVDSAQVKIATNVAHFLNCLLSSHEDKSPATAEESAHSTGAAPSKRKHKKKKNAVKDGIPNTVKTGAGSIKETLSAVSLWKFIKDDVEQHYKFTLSYTSISAAINECGLQHTSLLREFCIKMGIQILLRDYEYSSPSPFTEDDIVALVPVVKHTQFKPIDVSSIYELALARFNAGNFKFANELLTDALQLSLQIYGPMHTDIAKCYRLLARVHFLIGEIVTAITYQYKATLMYERLLGVDHGTTVSSYFNLAHYCVQSGQTSVALKLFYRVKYLSILSHGLDHPEIANIDFQIAVTLCNLKQYHTALKFLYSTLSLQLKYYGKDYIPMGMSHTLAAHALSELGEYREAMRHEKIAFGIFNEKLGADHEKTKKSSKCLQVLTEKAVLIQKQLKMVTDSASDRPKTQGQPSSQGGSNKQSRTATGGGKRKTK